MKEKQNICDKCKYAELSEDSKKSKLRNCTFHNQLVHKEGNTCKEFETKDGQMRLV